MPQNFLAVDREQVLLMPPSLADWLPEDHFVWTVLGAVEQMDLGAFYGAYRANGQGRAAYEPSMMVALLLYSYARGNRSSRGIERACRAAFKAAKERLAQKAGRGEEPEVARIELDPDRVAAGRGRRAWQRTAHKELMQRREQHAKPIARSRAERLLEALHRLEENRLVEIQANAAYEAWHAARRAGGVPGQKLGMPPKSVTPPAEPEGVMNKTDPDSRMMRTQGQPTMQGYNAQAAVTRGQIIVAAEIAVESPDFGHLEPTVRAALR